MIRFILAITLIVIYLIISVPIMLIFWILTKITPRARYWYQCAGQALLVTIRFVSGTKLTVIGREKIPRDTAVLFVGNHQSYFDVILAYSLMVGPTAFIAKDSFKKAPLLSWNMRFLKCLFIDRENLRQGVRTIMDAADMAKEGTSIFIFPEGTRNKSDDELNLGPFHDGSFKVAQRGKVPIVPVSFNNTASIFEKQFPKIRSAKVVVEFGDPVAWDDLDKNTQKHVGAHFRQVIIDMMKKNRELIG